MSGTQYETMLYGECGMLGVSGISSDMRVLLESADPRAQEATALFVYRISRVSAWVLPTDEELMIARHTAALVAAGRQVDVTRKGTQ
jgi:acetate kinase